jgi:transcriptional regulator with XRE-family HTH domain
MLKVREMAEKRGWNITRLSEASGVSYPQALTIWHDRARRYDVETLKRIASAFQVQVWELYEGSTDMTPTQGQILEFIKRFFPGMPERDKIDMSRWIEDLLYESVLEKLIKDQVYHRYKTMADVWAEEASEYSSQDMPDSRQYGIAGDEEPSPA